MDDADANRRAILALAKLESIAARVASGAMQMRVALAVGSTAPRYADQLRLAADASRLQYLALEADAALAAIEEVTCSEDRRNDQGGSGDAEVPSSSQA